MIMDPMASLKSDLMAQPQLAPQASQYPSQVPLQVIVYFVEGTNSKGTFKFFLSRAGLFPLIL